MTETEQIDRGAADLSAACAAAELTFQCGELRAARGAAEEILAAARARDDRPSEARALQLLGEIHYDVLAYRRSIEALDAAVALRRELFGEADLATRYSRACRAVVLLSLDRADEADADIATAMPAGGVPGTPAEGALHARFWV